MKVFLSHNMSGVHYNTVTAWRNEAKKYLIKCYGNNVHIIDNYHHDDAPKDAGRLWHLGRSIQQMQDTDLVVFLENSDSNGCKIEREVCKLYNIKAIDLLIKEDK